MTRALRLLGLSLLCVALFAGPAAAHGAGFHSPNVYDVHYFPTNPQAGKQVNLLLFLNDDSNVSRVQAVYCRIQNYACSTTPAEMKRTNAYQYDGEIAWDARFFEGVSTVGYKYEITYLNGTKESSPAQHYPSRPTDLPREVNDKYYYYTLAPAPAESPSPAAPLLLVVILLLAFAGRRNTR